jgi:hypothetical protein
MENLLIEFHILLAEVCEKYTHFPGTHINGKICYVV